MGLTPTYIRQQSITQDTGQQMAPLSLASNGVADAAAGVSDVLSAAGERISNRENSIARRKDFRAFQQGADAEFQRLEAEGIPDPVTGQVKGMDSKDTVIAFKKSIADLKAKAIAAHTGDKNSLAALQERMEEQTTRLEADFIAKHNQANRAIMDDEWNSEIAPISAAVARGDITLAEGNLKVAELAREDGDFAKTYDNLEMITKMEAAQGTMIVGSLNRMIAMEDFDTVKKQLSHQSVIDALPTSEYQKLTTSLAVHEKARTDLAAERSIARDERASELGINDITKATPAQQSYITTGKWAAGLQPTAIQQNMAYLNSLPKDSQIYRDTRQMMGLSPIFNPQTDTDHKDQQDFEMHKRGVDPFSPERADYVKARLATDKDYLNRMDQTATFTVAREGIEDIAQQIHMNYNSAVKSLFVLTDVEPLTDNPQDIDNAIKTAIKKAQDGKFASWVGGVYGDAAALADPKSARATLNGHLQKLQLTSLVETLAKLKEKTGAVGNTSDFEATKYIASQGSLDPDNLYPLADTLVSLIDRLPKTLEQERSNFQAGYSLVLKDDYKPSPPPVNSYLRGRAKMFESDDGTMVAPLDQFLPNKTKPGMSEQTGAADSSPVVDQAPVKTQAQPIADSVSAATSAPSVDEMREALDLAGGIEQIVTDGEVILPSGQSVTMESMREEMVAGGLFADDPEMQEAYDLISMSAGSLMDDSVINLPSGRSISVAEIREKFLQGSAI